MNATAPPRARRRAWPYVLPAMAFVVIFTYVPTILALVASTFNISITSDSWAFIGLDNYRTAIQDPQVHNAAWNTLWYCLMTVVPSIVLGLGLALAVDGLSRGRTLARTVLFLPMTANLVAMSIVFSWIFAYRGGFANGVLALVGIGPLNFLGDSSFALPTVAALGLWRATAFNMVIYAAGLTTIPEAIHHAAAVDGVRGLAKVRKVLWPLLKPSTVFVVVITVIQAIQVFDSIAVMTEGGPLGATTTLLFQVWRLGFQVFRLGYASAIAFIMLIVIVAIGLLRSRQIIRGGRLR